MFLSLISAVLLSCTTPQAEVLPDINGSGNGGGSSTEDVNTYYVSSNDELDELDDLTSEDVVVWRDGTYTDEIVKFYSPATLRAETPGGVIFKGKSYMIVKGEGTKVSGFHWENPTPVSSKAIIRLESGTKNCIIENCAITGFGLTAEPKVDTKWVSLYGTGHTVRNCTFLEKRNIGTLLVVWFEKGVVPAHTIENNYFTRPLTLEESDGDAMNGQETIRIGTSDWSMSEGGCTVRKNHFHNCHGERAEIISNKSCENLYEDNLFTENKGTLTLRHGNDCTVRNNIFLGEGMASSGGVRIIGEGHTVEGNYMENLQGNNYTSAICIVRGEKDAALNGYWQVIGATVKNNTIVDCNVGITSNYGARSSMVMPVISTKVENNIIIAPSSSNYSVYNVTSPAPTITWSGNKIYSGKQSGVSLETTTTKPSYLRPDSRINAIKSGAGASYRAY